MNPDHCCFKGNKRDCTDIYELEYMYEDDADEAAARELKLYCETGYCKCGSQECNDKNSLRAKADELTSLRVEEFYKQGHSVSYFTCGLCICKKCVNDGDNSSIELLFK